MKLFSLNSELNFMVLFFCQKYLKWGVLKFEICNYPCNFKKITAFRHTLSTSGVATCQISAKWSKKIGYNREHIELYKIKSCINFHLSIRILKIHSFQTCITPLLTGKRTPKLLLWSTDGQTDIAVYSNRYICRNKKKLLKMCYICELWCCRISPLHKSWLTPLE